MSSAKKEGDISNAFTSLSQAHQDPLPDHYRHLKISLIQGHEEAVVASWKRLLARLKVENREVERRRSGVVPRVRYGELVNGLSEERKRDIRARGVVVVEGVVEEEVARGYKSSVEEYVKANPHTTSFPRDNPQVYELYWSPPQVSARSHPNMLTTQQLLMQEFWTTSSPSPSSLSSSSAASASSAVEQAEIDLTQPLIYADRLRIRQPGDANFALGPHMDGGSVERWEREGYGDVYRTVFKGDWEAYDPWDARGRVHAVYDTSGGVSASGCSAFRMWQGWLSMSAVGPGEGTLLVNPLLKLSTVYLLLRPFFQPVNEGLKGESFLDVANWEFLGVNGMTSELQGATPGHGQELSERLHPHLELDKTMVSIPQIRLGDYVAWHCDTIHAVDQVHKGTSDSSVLYIPVCPLTARNAEYVRRQLECFRKGRPGPDFPGGEGEERHVGRPKEDDLTERARMSMGLDRFAVRGKSGVGGQKAVDAANRILGFDVRS